MKVRKANTSLTVNTVLFHAYIAVCTGAIPDQVKIRTVGVEDQYFPQLLGGLAPPPHPGHRTFRFIFRKRFQLAATKRNYGKTRTVKNLFGMVMPVNPGNHEVPFSAEPVYQIHGIFRPQYRIAPDMESCQRRHMGKKQHPPAIRRFVQHLQKMPQGFYGKPVAFSPFRIKGIQKNHPQPLLRIVCTIIRIISAKA